MSQLAAGSVSSSKFATGKGNIGSVTEILVRQKFGSARLVLLRKNCPGKETCFAGHSAAVLLLESLLYVKSYF